ncbi:putative type IX secretion system sortase PorU2 [Brumimicrobium mesophilum]|uniref:putative type IX secretion system sortase PorU2 n=1 Tax=Brumimicrobium mesophilum TaxID=392717 RepID=UPI000D1407A8|nr:C25 family cysteine peptidase [Brumimicrobium mesophilum]
MRIITTLLSVFLTITFVWAQPYGNEWIDYNQKYYKFGVAEDGVYQLSYQTLVNAGVPVNTIAANKFQIFGKEKELPLFVNDNGDNVINVGDYIEFYAESNDGWLDSLLYNSPDDIGNPAYSLYNDSLYYFLTWTTGTAKRFLIETDVNYSIYSPSSYVLEKSILDYHVQYYGGFSAYSSYSSFFSAGEGWGGPNYNGASNYTLTIPVPTPDVYTGVGAPDASFHAKSNANSNASFSGSGNHHLRWELGSSGTEMHDEIFIGYRQTSVNKNFNPSILSNGTTNAFFKIIGDQGASTDFQSVSYVSVEYPRIPNSNETSIDWEVRSAGTQAKSRLDISASNLINPTAYVFGNLNARKIPITNNGGVWQVLIPNSVNGANQKLIITSDADIKEINSISAVNGTGVFTDYSQINVEAAYILLYNQQMLSSATQYSSYRKTPNGGGYNVVMLEVNDAWMQYGGGVPKHILGSRRAINHIYNISTLKPVALFIAGKAISEASDPNTSSAGAPRKNAAVNSLNIVPSYGSPSSDICITAKWNGSISMKPEIPTGRIAANNNEQLNMYLQKVKIFEATQNQNAVYNKELKEWQKQVIHFGGGSTSQEQSLLQSYLNGMKNSIEGPDYGGNVTSYFKETSNPFNPVQSSEVRELLENGVSLMTFFGHATGDGFDQNIDDPENWNNTGKYPMVIGNGCYTGDIFKSDNSSTAESFVLLEDLGAIGFLSSSKLGYASYLNLYSAELYRQMSPDNYGASLGAQMSTTIRNLEIVNPSFLTEVTAMQMILHADPMIKLNWHAKPEIDLTIQDVYFTPSQVNLSTDSITVNVVLTNLGRSVTDTFGLTITRGFPNSAIDSVYNLSIYGLNYRDTIQFNMPLQASIGSGVNQFTIQADLPSFVPEQYDEFQNNEVKIDYFLNIDGIMPVLPYNYAVVPNDSIVLKASTINPIASFNTYRFEIDTTDLFNSPFLKYAVKSGTGGVKEVFPNDWRRVSNNSNSPLILEDSVAYFWRVSIDSSVYSWTEHSFQYIPNKTGWGQDHFFQFKNSDFNGVSYERTPRKREFATQQIELAAQVYDNSNSVFKYNSTLWSVNGQDAEYGLCTTSPSLHVGVVDPSTQAPWGSFYNGVNVNNQFGNANNGASCRTRVENYFIFRQNSASQLQAFENMIANEVPDGHFIVIYTTMRALYSQWQSIHPSLFTTLQNAGATGMSPSSPDRAFIFIYEKGDPSTAMTIHAQNSGEFISLANTFSGSVGSGIESSTLIGPAAEWQTIYWKQSSMETPVNDSTRLVIKGYDHNKQFQIEIDTVFSNNDSIQNFNTILSANDYPYLQLQAKYYDKITLTPAQVDRWHVLYQPLPEAAIDGSAGYAFLPDQGDSLQEGIEMSFAVDVKNISDLSMDSLLVNYWITDKNQVKHPINYMRQDSLRPGQVLRDTVQFSTQGLSGENTFWMEVNPYNKGVNNQLKDQPELAHFNNLLQISFFLKVDDVNPILDVTFDGEHILNGDIVSPKAEIVIGLKDENPFLMMNNDADTSNFGIFLTHPNGDQKRVPFIDGNGNQILTWIPANGTDLRFEIIYNAEFEESGVYELMVQGSDNSGNLSGDIEYRIQFEVILESTITHLMNYPNPFSTSTRFVFTLTGTEVPEDMIIQIMTVTGRIVREITEDELGFIRIGRNITEYAWDGRDEFGDPLANGVYLYRMKAKINGEDIKHRETGADQYFKKNWGKMYLMR